MSLFDQIKLLHSQKLHSNVAKVVSFDLFYVCVLLSLKHLFHLLQAEMVLKVSEHTTDILTAPHKFRIYAYLGDSHYFLSNYRQAEAAYKSALTFKDAYSTTKTSLKQYDGQKDPMPDIG